MTRSNGRSDMVLHGTTQQTQAPFALHRDASDDRETMHVRREQADDDTRLRFLHERAERLGDFAFAHGLSG